MNSTTRNLFLFYITFLNYCALTIASINDARLFVDQSISLPLLGIQLDLDGFFFVGPLILILLYIYFHIHLSDLLYYQFCCEKKDDSEIGKKRCACLDKTWPLFDWLVPTQCSLFNHRFKRFISNFLVWWSLPAINTLFLLFYLKKHAWSGTLWLTTCTFASWYLMRRFQKIRNSVFGSSQKSKKLTLVWEWLPIFAILAPIWWVFLLSFSGNRDFGWNHRINWPFVDLKNLKLVSVNNEKFLTVYWIDLFGAQLQGASLNGSALERADLKWAQLTNAELWGTYLDGARVARANLRRANLRKARFCNADLNRSDLRFADMEGTDLSNANLRGAKLTKVKNLTVEQLLAAKNPLEAALDDSLRQLVEAHLLKSKKQIPK